MYVDDHVYHVCRVFVCEDLWKTENDGGWKYEEEEEALESFILFLLLLLLFIIVFVASIFISTVDGR